MDVGSLSSSREDFCDTEEVFGRCGGRFDDAVGRRRSYEDMGALRTRWEEVGGRGRTLREGG